jgi:hypothetical protein
MSAATASSTDETTVFVRLVDEGTDVWRPVRANRIGANTCRIAEQVVPEDEIWIFQPGDVVVVEGRQAEDDSAQLIAVARATQFDDASWNRLRKSA